MGKMLSGQEIQNRILNIRGMQVMIDNDLAEMYGVETKVLNQAVKRNIERFPENFLFQLTADEYEPLRSQIVTLKPGRGQHRKYQPYVFTEQGVAMLSAVLKSETAVKVSIRIMEAFVEMRRLVIQNAVLFNRLDSIERKQLETDQKFEQVFKALESKNPEPDYGIFFEGQIFDAYVFISDLFKNANHSIILIDNYVDESTLTHLTKRKGTVSAIIYTQSITKSFQLDLKKHNEQYPNIEVKSITTVHDRFLIIDEENLYHIGASLKDLGKKWFAFSKMNSLAGEVMEKLK